MADPMDFAPPARRRRSDARRSIDAIVSGARAVLGERVDASMEEIAVASGLTRQTVYAHFPSRDLLVAAAINAERAEGLAAVEAADLDDLPPVEALHRFLDISWEIVDRFPLVLDPAFAKTPGLDGGDAHELVGTHLERIIRRGQRSGVFDHTLPPGWLAATTFGLGHSAAEEVAAGRLTIGEVKGLLLRSTLRLYGADASSATSQ
jgi:AcrR family transcriptional regulator